MNISLGNTMVSPVTSMIQDFWHNLTNIAMILKSWFDK